MGNLTFLIYNPFYLLFLLAQITKIMGAGKGVGQSAIDILFCLPLFYVVCIPFFCAMH